MRIDARIAALSAAMLLPLCASGFAQEGRMTGIKLDGGQPIQIESDRLEVRDSDGTAVFTGNVSVVQGPTLLRAGNMTVYYKNQGDGASAASAGSADIDRLEVSGKVYVRSEKQVATGDAGSFDMRTEVLTLTGKEVVLTEGDNVIVGCKLTVQMATGQAQLDGCGGSQSGGRVKMLLNPGSAGR